MLGANDGIVSTAGVVMGVAGATDDSGAIVIAGIAALIAGALSMGSRRVRLGQHPARLREVDPAASRPPSCEQMPQTEERELAAMYVEKGLSPETRRAGRRAS